jgi:hypothetical protein
VSIRDLVSEGVCQVVAYGLVVCFNFAEVCAYACVAAGVEGVCDGEERVTVNIVYVSGTADHEKKVVRSQP